VSNIIITFAEPITNTSIAYV